MSLTDFAKISIVSETAQALQAGFGVPLLLSPSTPAGFGDDRVRFYSSLAGLVADGFATTGPEYLMMQRLLGQERKPEKVAIGRRANKPTMSVNVTPAVANSTTYKLRVRKGTVNSTVSVTSDSTALNTEIVAALKTAIDALATGLTTVNNTTHLTITGAAAGDWFAVEASDVSKLAVAMVHTDAGVAADLDAIALVDSSWYAVLNPTNSKAEAEAVAVWIEAQDKTFLCTTQDTAVITTSYVAASNSDIATRLKDLGLVRTKISYHPATDGFLACAEAGLLLPTQPGSETWNAKRVSGTPVTSFTTTHLTNLKAKNCGWLYSVAGLNVTAQGKTSSGEFYDVVRGRDWLKARLAERIFSRMANSTKLAFTDDGIAVIVAEVRAQLQEAVEVGLVAPDSYTVSFPKASAVSAADKAARTLKNVSFTAVLAGAIHATEVNGVISLT